MKHMNDLCLEKEKVFCAIYMYFWHAQVLDHIYIIQEALLYCFTVHCEI